MSFDELPVGQQNKFNIPELPPDISPQTSPAPSSNSGTLAERLKNKNIKTRLEAFTELLKLFMDAGNSDNTISEHYNKFSKYIADTHPGIQEKALESLLVLIGKSPPQIEPSLTELINSLIERGLLLQRQQIKQKQ